MTAEPGVSEKMEAELSEGPKPPSSVEFQAPVGIVHSKEEEKKDGYSAVGVLIRPLPPEMKTSDEICAFSQELLRETEELGTIVVSNTWKGTLKWHYLCNQKTKLDDPKFMNRGVHVFDAMYLKEWVKRGGTGGIQCPLCKSGAQQAKQIEEHQIDSIDQLIERRLAAKGQHDLMLQFFVEQLMLAKIVEENWEDTDLDRARKNEDLLRDVLRHWHDRNQINVFQEKILNAMDKAIKADLSRLVKVLCARGLRDTNPEKKRILTDMSVLAAKNNAFRCLKVLCEEFRVEFETRPRTLLAAVKAMNMEMVEYVMDVMTKSQTKFVCDDVFQEVIKKDMVDIAKAIIINRWHKPNDRDFALAERLEGNVGSYLASRKRAVTDVGFIGTEDELIDSDEWGEDSEDGNFSDDAW